MLSPRYDRAVVGSSPLLLAMALRLNQAGHSVVLYEMEDKLGGAWQVEEVDGIGPVECACHLLEWYVGSYDTLTRITGARFVPSDPQPVRVFRNGRILPYTSRMEIVRATFWSWASVAAGLARATFARPSERSVKLARLAAAWRAFVFHLRFRLPGLVAFDAVRRPEKGYTAFTDDLRRAVEASGIEVVSERVSDIAIHDDHAVLRHGGRHTRANQVILGESSRIDNLEHETGRGLPEAKQYYHAVIGLPSENVLLRSDYVHMPDDPVFHRITYVRDHETAGVPSVIFLVQLRRPAEAIVDLQSDLDTVLRRSGIATSADGFVVHKIFAKQYMQRHAAGRPPPSGPVVQYVRTIGDLSRNAVLQAKLFERIGQQQRAEKPLPGSQP